jgi:hypothetical protein
MNDPWNRFSQWPSIEPFGESVGPSATPPIPSGGILGNLGQTMQAPSMDSRPAPIASAAQGPLVGHPWDHSWLYRSPLEISDPEAAKFLAAWRRIYAAPSLFGFLPPTNSTQSRTSLGTDDQFSAASTPEFTSPLKPLGQSPAAVPNPNGWQGSTSMNPLHANGLRNFAPTAADLNTNYWGATPPPPPLMNPGAMPDSTYSPLTTPREPTWDTTSARTPARGAELLPEPPNRSSWKAPAGTTDLGWPTSDSE